MNGYERIPDHELLDRSQSGDRGAFVQLSWRHLSALHDLALRITLSQSLAQTAVTAGLNRSVNDTDRPDGVSVAAWLLGLVRTAALDGLRGRRRSSDDDVYDPTDPRLYELPADSPLASQGTAARLSWESARALRPRDYSLLDLLLRRGLTPDEVSDVSDLPRTEVFGVLGRLRGGFEESFKAAMLFESEAGACADLDRIRGDASELSPALRREIGRHAASCPACDDTSAGFPAAAELFASFANLEPSPELIAAVEALVLEIEPPGQVALPIDLVGAPPGDSEEPTDLAETPGPEEPPGEDEEGEEEADGGAEPLEAAAAAGAASDVAFESGRREALLRFDREVFMGEPPSPPPWSRLADWFGESPGRRVIVLLLVVLTALAAYLGYAVGDSIEGGGDDGSDAPTPTPLAASVADLPTRTAGLRVIACGDGPVELAPGFQTTIDLASDVLAGYSFSSVNLEALTAGATVRALTVQEGDGLSLSIEALAVSAPGATDEYQVEVTFEKTGSDSVVSDCAVNVVSNEPTLTPTPAPATETPEPGAAATPLPPTAAPQPTEPPVQATQPPPPPPQPTATPAGPSPTPTRDPNSFIPTFTPTATRTPVPPSPTPSATPPGGVE
jgi:DNA-directed RNA polymerase specialized sigma24 family protein